MIHFSLAHYEALLLLLLLPCFIWCKQKAKIIYFPKVEWLPKYGIGLDNISFFLMLIYTLLVLALSRPYMYSSKSSSYKRGRDLVLILDSSGSMANRGFSKDNLEFSRYDISVSLTKDFIKNRFDDNIGLVIFGSFAYSASPLSYDLQSMNEMFDLMSDIGIAGSSTAIGDAIIQGVETLKAGEAKSKVLILLTDGKHNAGVHSPKEGVELAKSKGIKIYTIGIGKDYDKELLDTIANETKAKSFFALNGKELKEIYNSIEKLEPSSIPSHSYIDKDELFIYPLYGAIILLLIVLYKEEQMI